MDQKNECDCRKVDEESLKKSIVEKEKAIKGDKVIRK